MNAAIKLRSGGVSGAPFMKFTLTYEGSLPASGNSAKTIAKWNIRKAFHPQLMDLIEHHPALEPLTGPFLYPAAGAMLVQPHHSHEGEVRIPKALLKDAEEAEKTAFDLNAPIFKFGYNFRPLVRETYALHCGLKVVFLRHEPPGRIYQGGDIDGRIKTLLDALTMPQHREQMIPDNEFPDPLFCLLEDDSMVSGLQVETERLLDGRNQPSDFVKLFIEVDVRIRFPALYNHCFGGS